LRHRAIGAPPERHYNGLRRKSGVSQMACKPGFVCHALRHGDGHSSGMTVARHLKRPTRTAQGGKPLRKRCRSRAQPLFGLAPGGVCPASHRCRDRGALLPHHFTLTRAKRGRYIFCGTFPWITPGGRYPPPLSVEPGLSSRPCGRAAIRPSGGTEHREAGWNYQRYLAALS
jgi:hypothetical protein